jgi:SET domain-containing protein
LERRRCCSNCCKAVATGVSCGNAGVPYIPFPAAEITVVKAVPPKGYGLFSMRDLKSGTYLMEFIGVVHTDFDFTLEKNCYVVGLGQPGSEDRPMLFINALKYGNETRLINHSCDPNCMLEGLLVDGVQRGFIKLIKNVSSNTELTFDYRWPRKKLATCYCGSAKCRYSQCEVSGSSSKKCVRN